VFSDVEDAHDDGELDIGRNKAVSRTPLVRVHRSIGQGTHWCNDQTQNKFSSADGTCIFSLSKLGRRGEMKDLNAAGRYIEN